LPLNHKSKNQFYEKYEFVFDGYYLAGAFYLFTAAKTPPKPKPEGENYEIMYVEIDLIMGADGVYVFRQDKEPEIIDISLMQSKSNIQKNGKIDIISIKILRGACLNLS